jgi:outer membrane protein assembly factor BamD
LNYLIIRFKKSYCGLILSLCDETVDLSLCDETVDMADSKSAAPKACWFDSSQRYQNYNSIYMKYMFYNNYSVLIIIFFVIASNLAGCKSKISNLDEISPAVIVYEAGLARLQKERYKSAAQEFANVYFQHPGSPITPYAEIMEAYSYYLLKHYQDTIDILDNFIKIHPLHQDISYAYYLKAMAAFRQLSDVYYDQSSTILAQESLQSVVEKFPDTPYARDAREKIEVTKDYLAAKDMEIGKYYMKARNNPIAALGRFQAVIKQDTHHAPEALYRLVECSLMMGLKQEAKLYALDLVKKFPESHWGGLAAKNLKLDLP